MQSILCKIVLMLFLDTILNLFSIRMFMSPQTQSNPDQQSPNLAKYLEELNPQIITLDASTKIQRKSQVLLGTMPEICLRRQNKSVIGSSKKSIVTNSSKPKLVLPAIAKSSFCFAEKKIDRQYAKKQTLKISAKISQKPNLLRNQTKFMVRPSKSVQIKKKKDKTLKQEVYLPAFIRNFELPPRQKFQVIQTMDAFKRREATIMRFLSSLKQLEKYKILSQIGKGSFSTVSLAKDIQTNTKYAIKIYKKFDQIEDFKFVNIEREIENMYKLNDHMSIVQIRSVIVEKRRILLIMQNCGQQSLAGILRKRKSIPQAQAKFYMKQIVQGIVYCHQKGVCHRDLKLQNILLNQSNNIKIIDFGFSCATNRQLNSFCGTPPYMAPQILSKCLYDGKGADIWSIGVILYVMLYGTFPFKSIHENELFRLIQQGKIQHNQTISCQAKQTINAMLNCNVSSRATAQQVLNKKWLQT